MHHHKLLHLLATLSRREMTRFRDFAHSPYHNKHQGVRDLAAYLSESYPDFGENTCGSPRLFDHLFPGEKFDKGKLAVVFTYTYRLWEEFARQERMRERPQETSVYLLEDIRERSGLLFEKKLEQLVQELEEGPFRDSRHHLLRYQLATEADRYFTQQGKHELDNSIQAKQEHLDHYLITEKLRDACEMVARRRILRISYEVSLLEPLLREVEAKWERYAAVPSVAVYYQIYNLLNGKTGNFFEVVAFLQAHEGFFPLEERQLLYHYLQNYCIEQINKGHAAFLRHSFELYQRQLETGLLFIGETLPEGHYKNLVTIGLRLDEHEWVRDFIHHFKDKLPPALAENAFSFNLASYYYATGQLGKVQELLHQVEYTDLRYNLGAKALLLRTYFDLEEDEALLSLADSFQQYLKRNKLLADERVQAFSRLLRFTKRAMVIRAQADYLSPGKVRQAAEKLLQQIGMSGAVINREWLVGKVEEVRR
jgi:hypothetical protein